MKKQISYYEDASFLIGKNHSLNYIIEQCEYFLKKGYTSICINGYDADVNVIGYRDETDEQYLKRLKKEKIEQDRELKKKQKEELRNLKQKEKIKKREYNYYLKLKKKYEKNGMDNSKL